MTVSRAEAVFAAASALHDAHQSFYAWHRENEYQRLCNAEDNKMKLRVQRFNPYDSYSKNPNRPKLADVKPY